MVAECACSAAAAPALALAHAVWNGMLLPTMLLVSLPSMVHEPKKMVVVVESFPLELHAAAAAALGRAHDVEVRLLLPTWRLVSLPKLQLHEP